MRIHGKYKISRRADTVVKPYSQYLDELKEDFCNICGYCGKSEQVTKKGFEIDHFIPQKLASHLKDDYRNLVYSCFTCNRKKGSKWPTKDISLHNDGSIGLVDPATDEYDTHLQRDENGKIISTTSLGRYMQKKIFMFDKRPTDVIWKAMRIIELKNQLRKQLETMPREAKFKEYVSIDKELDELMNYIFEKKE